MAASERAALACCEERRPQIVETDLSIPNLDGRRLARWLRWRCPSVSLILVTAQTLDGPTLRIMRRTFTDVMSERLDLDRHLGLIDRLMPRLGISALP